MDIVERAVELLAASPETRRRSQTGDAAAAGDAADRIERIVAAELDFPAQAADHRPAGPGPDTASAAAPSPTSRRVTIDRALLRRQRIIAPDEDRTPMTESFRRVKRHIVANANERKPGVLTNLVMLTSALPGEGKTFCSINLAISLAMEVDRTVLLVDADVAKPSIAQRLGIEPAHSKGFMDVLLNPGIALSEVMYSTDIGKLSVMPAGRHHARATEVLASETTKNLLHEIATRYEDRIVIFDSAPLLAASESSALASHMGQVIIVVEAERTTERALREALDRVGSSNLAGVLLNKGAKPSAALGGYDYGYGYGYGS